MGYERFWEFVGYATYEEAYASLKWRTLLRGAHTIMSLLKRRTHPWKVHTLLRRMHMPTWSGLGFWALVQV